MFFRQRHWVVRSLRVAIGLAMLGLGLVLILPGIPGPGFVLVIVSLGILSAHFGWAKRLRERLDRVWHAAVRRRRSGREREKEPYG